MVKKERRNRNMERRNAWLAYTEAEEKELEETAAKYRYFLDQGKTERECVTQIIREAEAAGYESLEKKLAEGGSVKAGDKVYTVGMKKIIALYHIGQEPLEKGMNILCAHIDSPRLDIKQNPLYEDTDLAYLDTHYYGGVKKYQWVALPLAMHGVVVRKDGTVVDIKIGEDESDPVLYITDLLIHLSAKQLQKTAAEVIEGTSLVIQQDGHLLFLCKPHSLPEHGEGKLGQRLGIKLGMLLNICPADFPMRGNNAVCRIAFRFTPAQNGILIGLPRQFVEPFQLFAQGTYCTEYRCISIGYRSMEHDGI